MNTTQEIDELLSLITGKTVISPERGPAIERIALAAPRGERVEIAREKLPRDYTGTLYVAQPNGEIELRKGEQRKVSAVTPVSRRTILASGLLALAALQFPFSCGRSDSTGNITVSGVVIEEQYVPSSVPGTPSQYFFFLERPEVGRQAVEVQNYYDDGIGCEGDYLTKESLDFRIVPGGVSVEISGLTPEELQQGLWQVPANRIRVYQLEE
ncbi:hypothetical protein HYS49_03885 [Candidatus Woesearchaeota archaeon]|nr:hypothetical protein [Candidatus Woesearchaeota archaeon]